MKKNKFLIYIALFFVIFMLGTTKVKATKNTYLECKYEIPYTTLTGKKFIDDSGKSYTPTYRFKLYIEFANGKVNKMATNKTCSYAPGNGENWSNNVCNHNDNIAPCESADYDDYFTIGNIEKDNKCPTVTAKSILADSGWYKIKSAEDSTDSTIEMTNTDTVYFSSYNRNCIYENESGDEETTILVDYDPSLWNCEFFDMLHGTTDTPYNVRICKIEDESKNVSEAVLRPKFFEEMQGYCPTKYFEYSGLPCHSSTTFGIAGQNGTKQCNAQLSGIVWNYYGASFTAWRYKYRNCTVKDETEYNTVKNYVDNISLDGLDSLSDEEKNAKKTEYYDMLDEWLYMMTRDKRNNSEEDCKKDVDEIQKKFGEIAKEFKKAKIISEEELADAKETLSQIGEFIDEGLLKWTIDYGYNKTLDCGDIFDDDVMDFLKTIFTWIRIAIPILLIILGMIDFSQVIVSQDPDAMKKCTSKFTKRCIVAIIIFFLPTIIMLILQWINDYVMTTNPECVIKDLNIIVRNILK